MKRLFVLSGFCASLLLASAANAKCYQVVIDNGRLVKWICDYRPASSVTGREVVKKNITVFEVFS